MNFQLELEKQKIALEIQLLQQGGFELNQRDNNNNNNNQQQSNVYNKIFIYKILDIAVHSLYLFSLYVLCILLLYIIMYILLLCTNYKELIKMF